MSYYHQDHDRQYDYDHQARVREVLTRKVATLPYEVVIKLQEVASALEFGEPLDLIVARHKLAPSNLERGGVQVQPDERVDFHQTVGNERSRTARQREVDRG